MKRAISYVMFVAIAVFGGNLSALWLTGIAEYSFDEGFRILRTGQFIYQLRTDQMSRSARAKFKHPGSRISADIPATAIVAAWPVLFNQSYTPSPEEVSKDSIVQNSDSLLVTGTVLPMGYGRDGFVQVEGVVVRIRTGELPETERAKLANSGQRQSVTVPVTAIDFAWQAAPSEVRFPASLGPIEPDHFEVSNSWLKVTGTVLYAFEKDSLQVQSGQTFFLINDSASQPVPGSRVSIRIPLSALKMVWAMGETEMHAALPQD